MIRLFITEDHELYLKGLSMIIGAEQGFVVCGRANAAQQTLEMLPSAKPDVLLLDINLPDMEPEPLLKNIRLQHPDLPVVYHTMLRGTRYVHRLMQYGVQGYILKNAGLQELITAIRTAAAGGTYYSKEIDITDGTEDAVKKTVFVPDSRIHAILSKREKEVLQLICKEYSNAEIAAKLFLSISTVDTHRKNIIEKLGVNNTVGLVKFAVKNGLIND